MCRPECVPEAAEEGTTTVASAALPAGPSPSSGPARYRFGPVMRRMMGSSAGWPATGAKGAGRVRTRSNNRRTNRRGLRPLFSWPVLLRSHLVHIHGLRALCTCGSGTKAAPY